MDHALVEQITKLVISKLTEQPRTDSLSNVEIEHWNQITASFWDKKIENSSFKDNKTAVPLSNEEIERWNEITVSMGAETKEKEQIKLYKYNA